MQGRGKSGKQALNLTEEMVRLVVMMSVSCDDLISQVYEMNRSGSASGGYSSGLEAAYHNYGMDMESWKSDKYSQGRYKVGVASTESVWSSTACCYSAGAPAVVEGALTLGPPATGEPPVLTRAASTTAGRQSGTRHTGTTRPRTTLTPPRHT